MSGPCTLIDDEHDWVVVILDPDWDDWSPWNVTAPDLAGAIAKAKKHWRRFAAGEDDWDREDEDVVAAEDKASEADETEADEDLGDPGIIKVYRGWVSRVL